ncbi:MAG TPA: hypothetical protein VGR74_23450 [Actinomycetota bacterium]|nr:hypothetical protein [Actinomycetota bacterium]
MTAPDRDRAWSGAAAALVVVGVALLVPPARRPLGAVGRLPRQG